MHHSPESDRFSLELREAMSSTRGYTVADWPTSSAPAWLGAVPARPTMAECTCPTDCIRDHEYE